MKEPANNGIIPSAQNTPAQPPGRNGKIWMPSRTLELDTNRTLPHSVEAEMGMLSCMFKEPQKCIPIATQRICAEQLYVPRHQLMFNALVNFLEDHGPFDLLSFTVEMMQTGQDKAIGGPGWITEVHQYSGASEAIGYYLDIVCDKYALRQIIAADTESVCRAYEQGAEAQIVLADREKRIEMVRVKLGAGHLRLPALSDAAFYANGNCPPKPFELVKGILHQGSKLIVGGTSKGCKTMALLDLAVSVATGSSWWGFPCGKAPVCYINFEIQDAFFAERVNEVRKAKGVALQPEMFFAWNLRGHCEGIEKLIDDLMIVLRDHKFVLIIIDPIYKALGNRDENKASDVASMLNELEKIAVKTGAAVAFGAHYSKGNQSRKESIDRIVGSGVFARDPDSILTMTAHEEEEAFAVEATLRNFAPAKPFVVRWEWPLFTRADDLDPVRLKRPRTAKSGQFEEKYSSDLLLNLLSFDEGLKPGDAVKRLRDAENMSRDTIYRMRKKLMKENLLVERDGLWFRGNGKAAE